MTFSRATAPGPRSAARHGTGRRVVLALLLLATTMIAACGSSAPAAPSAVPQASLGPTTGSGAQPSGPRWPAGTIEAVLALGAADGELEKGGLDLQAAVEKQDVRAMWGAADGLARLLDKLTPLVDRLDGTPATQPAAVLYRTAFPELSAGARQLRDAITAGDSAGILAGSQQIARGLAAYRPVRSALGPLVEQALAQKTFLVK